jgi:putative transposase
VARPLRIQYPNAFYHVTSRGNERKAVFRTDKDRQRFLVYLQSAHERYGALIHVYCLMGNHYHLLLETPRSNLSQILHHVNGAYTTYFNVKRKRSGHLFQGRYRAILVEKDAYCQELSRYIHLNPLRAGMVKDLRDYPWSSYAFYVGLKKKPSWLETDDILGYYGQRESQAQKKYREYVEEGIGGDQRNPLRDVFASTFLGGQEFIKQFRQRCRDGEEGDSRNLPVLKALKERPTLDEIRKRVGEQIEAEDRLFKKVCIHISHEYGGFSLKEIGSFYNMEGSAVSQASRRFKQKIMGEPSLNRSVKQIVKTLGLLNVDSAAKPIWRKMHYQKGHQNTLAGNKNRL